VAPAGAVSAGTVLAGVTSAIFPSLDRHPITPPEDSWFTVWIRDDVEISESLNVADWATTLDDIGAQFYQAVKRPFLDHEFCRDNNREWIAVSPRVTVVQPLEPSITDAAASNTAGVAADPPRIERSAHVPPSKAAPSTVSLGSTKARAGSVRFRVKVSVAGTNSPVGKLRVTWKGGKRTVRLTKADHGRASVALPNLPKGSHSITIKYVASSGSVRSSAAKPFRVKVI
jgi:hypothetical protein